VKASTSAISNEYKLLVDYEDWFAILEPALCKDSVAVECLARLLFMIKKAIDNGPDGVEQARRALQAGIESAYLYTEAHRAARELYVLSLTGHLKPQDEPLQLINGAIKRGTVEREFGKQKGHRKRTGVHYKIASTIDNAQIIIESAIPSLAVKMAKLAEAQARTDRRLNALIDIKNKGRNGKSKK
jgi:hypothetical protein